MQSYIICGYSLDACYRARELAELGHSVVFYKTSDSFHSIHFDYNNFLRHGSGSLINKFIVSPFEVKIFNKEVHFDYSELRITNSTNGYIKYPYNVNMFESAYEYEQIVSIKDDIKEAVAKKYKIPNEYSLFCKRKLPKWFYESLLRNVGLNKWQLQKHSLLNESSMKDELNLSRLFESNNVCVVDSFTDSVEVICEKLLTHSKIKIFNLSIKAMGKLIRVNDRNNKIIIMDNRVDRSLDYLEGVFDKIKFSKKETLDFDYAPSSNFIIYTPSQKHFSTISYLNRTYHVYSHNCVVSSEDVGMLKPTLQNQKYYMDYKKILHLFNGKELDLSSRFDSVLLFN